MLCQVTGEFRTPNGVVHSGATVKFRRSAGVHPYVDTGGPVVVIPDEMVMETAVDGTGTIKLYPGRYQVELLGSNGAQYQFKVNVPTEETILFPALLGQAADYGDGGQIETLAGYASAAFQSEEAAATSAAQAAIHETNAEAAAEAAETAQQAAESAAETAFGAWRGPWGTGLTYALYDRVSNLGSTYYATEAHVAGATFAGDAGKWGVIALKGTSGGGGGDLLSENNLSDVENPTAALENLNGQPKHANLTAEAGLTGAADKVAMFTGVGAKTLITVTEFARTILDDTTDAGVRGTIGAQAQHAHLDELVALTLVEGDILYVGAGGAIVRLAKSTDGKVLSLASGVPAWVDPSVGIDPYAITITASVTWDKPAGYADDDLVIFEAWGAGGGGGRCSTAEAGGGGGGRYARLEMRYADVPSSLVITIGTPGAGRSGSTGNGSPGTATTIGTLLTAGAGLGGPGVGSGSAPGGAGGKFNGLTWDPWQGGVGGVGGGDGGNSIHGGAGGGGSSITGTSGGVSQFGGNGGNGGDGSPAPTAGDAPGGGGGAGYSNTNGAAGARGEVRIRIK